MIGSSSRKQHETALRDHDVIRAKQVVQSIYSSGFTGWFKYEFKLYCGGLTVLYYFHYFTLTSIKSSLNYVRMYVNGSKWTASDDISSERCFRCPENYVFKNVYEEHPYLSLE